MTSDEVKKALPHALIGVAWRFVIFLVAALAFSGMVALRKWHGAYAPSPQWADRVADEGREWSSIVAVTARDMPETVNISGRPTAYTEDALFTAIRHRIERIDTKAFTGRDLELVAAYQRRVAQRDGIREKRLTSLKPYQDRFAEESAKLAANRNDLIKNEGLKERGSAAERATADAAIKTLLDDRKNLLEELKQLTEDIGTIDGGASKTLSELDTKIAEGEAGMRKAFDAGKSYARPVHAGLARVVAPETALHIGDETDPLHIVYVVIWYGLQGLIVAAICFVVVPWLLKLAGNKADSNEVRSKVTQWIKDHLGQVFGTAGTAVGKAVITVTVATAAAVASSAAGQSPPVIPAVKHEVVVATTGQKGDKGNQGEPGKTGSAAVIPPELEQTIADQAKKIADQAARIDDQAKLVKTQREVMDGLKTDLQNVRRDADANKVAVDALGQNAGALTANVGLLVDLLNENTSALRLINGNVAGVTESSNKDIASSAALNKALVSAIAEVEKTTGTTTGKIDDVRATVDQTAADILTGPQTAGKIVRWAPWRKYQVTDAVVAGVTRASKTWPEAERTVVLDGLKRMRTDPELTFGPFRALVEHHTTADTNSAVRDHINALMPYIAQMSLVTRRKG